MNKTNRNAILIVFCMLLFGCAAPVSEKVIVPFDTAGWKLAHKQQDRLNSSVYWEHIPEGEYISKWTRLYTVQFYDTKLTDLSAFLVNYLGDLTQKCKSLDWKILHKRPDATLFEWRSRGCTRFKERHELAIVIRGQKGIHRVAYSENKRQIPEPTYSEWQKKLLEAHLGEGSH